MAKIAVIETGGKQYVVAPDTVLKIEKLTGVSEAGSKITFDKVLLVDDGSSAKIGEPYVSGAKVTGELLKEGRNAKVTVLRYRPKSRYKKTKGHRQPYAQVRIISL